MMQEKRKYRIWIPAAGLVFLVLTAFRGAAAGQGAAAKAAEQEPDQKISVPEPEKSADGKAIVWEARDVYGTQLNPGAQIGNTVIIPYGNLYEEGSADKNYRIPVDKDASGVSDRDLYIYEVTDEEGKPLQDPPYQVDESGIVSFVRAMEENEHAFVRVRRVSREEGQADAEAVLELRVTPRRLLLDTENTVFTAEKTYDGTSDTGNAEILMTGRPLLKDADGRDELLAKLTEDQELTVIFEGGSLLSEGVDAGVYEAQKIGDIRMSLEGAGSGNYCLEIPEEILAEYTIRPREYRVRITEGEREYGTKEYITEPALSRDGQETNFLDGLEDQNRSDTDFRRIQDCIRLQDHSTETSPMERFRGSRSDRYISPEVLCRDAGNYTIVQDEESWGRLVITEETIDQEEVISMILLKGSENYALEEGKIWLKGEYDDTPGKLKISPAVKNRYSTAEVIPDGGYRLQENTRDVVLVPLSEGKTEERAVRFKLVNRDRQGITAETGELRLQINVDSERPEALIPTPEPIPLFPLEVLEGKLSFGIYKNTGYEVRPQVTDQGAGIEAWSYAVREMAEESLTAEKLREDAGQGKILWRNGSDQGRIPVYEGNICPEENNILENRVVLIRAADKVGNSVIYTSQGVIIENHQPQIRITGLEKYVPADCGSEGRIPFRLTVDDAAGQEDGRASAGIASIDVMLLGDQGEGIFLQKADGEPARWTDQELTEEVLFVPSAEYIRQKGLGTDGLRLTVTAVDRAGNELRVTEQMVMDLVWPAWSWDFEEASFSQNSDGKPYTKEPVTVKATIKERNFDPERTVLTVERDGKKEEIPFSDTSGGRISLEYDTETEDGGGKNSEDRTLMYSLGFWEEGEYTISLDVKDKCGNAAGEAAGRPLSFVIDQTPPEVSVAFRENDSRREEKYFRTARTAKITFCDRNPDMEHMGITVSAENLAGEKLDETETCTLKILKERVGTGALFSVISYEDSGDDSLEGEQGRERTVTVTVQFHPGAAYTIREIFCRDAAGNQAKDIRYSGQEPYREFTVDNREPEGEIRISAGDSFWKNLWSAVTFGIFSNKEREKITIMASDETSPVERIQYLVLSEIIPTREEFAEREKTGEFDRMWQQRTGNGDSGELTVSFTRSPNEKSVVYAKLTDAAGNIRYISSDGFVLDDVKPRWDEIAVLDTNRTESGIFHGDVYLHIRVQDPEDNGDDSRMICSGLRDVYYVVKDIHDAGRADIRYILRNGQLVDNGQENGNRYAEASIRATSFPELLEERSAPIQSLEADITIPAWDGEKGYNSNGLYVEFYAADHAGNLISGEAAGGKRAEFSIDRTAPAVILSYDRNEPLNDKYFKENRRAFLIFRERNFDPSRVEADLTVEGVRFTGTLEELMKADIVDIRGEDAVDFAWEEDSQGGRSSVKEYTDARTNGMCITFKGNAAYELHAVSITDAADNTYTALAGNLTQTEAPAEDCGPATFTIPEGTKAPLDFVVDKIRPEISVSYSGNGENAAHSRYYSREVTAVFTVNEHNFDQKEEPPEFVITSRDLAGRDIEGHIVKDASWISQGDIRTYKIRFQGDANYTLEAACTDLAGNALRVPFTDAFTVDKSAAETASIELEGHGIWHKLLSVITFGLFDDHSVKVSLEGKDGNDENAEGQDAPEVSPVEPLRYYKSAGQMTKAELEALPSSAWTEGSNLSVNPDQKFVIYLKVTNYAGLTSYFSSDGMIMDDTDPVSGISITNLSQAKNGIFSENVRLEIHVEEPDADSAFAGLEKVWYRIWADGNSRALEERVILDNTGMKKQGDRNFRYILEVDAEEFNSNDVKVQVFASDLAGNEMKSRIQQLKIDVTKPVISVAWDLNEPANGRYYKAARTAAVTVRDRNFDPEQVKFSITNTDGAAAVIGGWSSSSDIGISDQAVSTCRVSFPEDGDYTFFLECSDLAGNTAEYGQTEEFTIDKTPPEIKVTYDKERAVNDGYYSQKRTAIVCISEHNFNASDVRASITASLEGRVIPAPSISAFSREGDTHTAAVTYDTDGDYIFDIEYTDLAGNTAEDYAPDSFTVDLTPPEVEISGVADRSANNDVVAPVIRYTDRNCDADGASVTLEGVGNGIVEVEKSIAFFGGGQVISFRDFPREERMDDLYQLTAAITDLAGNKTEKTVVFSVNRYGSVYVLDRDTAAWLSARDTKGTYINRERRVGVWEYNVDDIQEQNITVNRDGRLTILEENKDYTVRIRENGEPWKACHYILNAENFKEEGSYRIVLSSRDAADNVMSNEAIKRSSEKQLPLAFTVDKTAPSVVISGIRDGGQYRTSSRTLAVDAKDNIALKQVTVKIGERLETYDAEELQECDGVIKTEIFSADKWQKVEVTAADAAGNRLGQNKTDGMEAPVAMTVLVTPSIIVQYFMNKPVLYGSAAFLLLAAVAAALLIKKRLRAG